ncbi:hypothetical protein PFISCL1PPCAC_23437, partial [Pristionchus fissidentatus]
IAPSHLLLPRRSLLHHLPDWRRLLGCSRARDDGHMGDNASGRSLHYTLLRPAIQIIRPFSYTNTDGHSECETSYKYCHHGKCQHLIGLSTKEGEFIAMKSS